MIKDGRAVLRAGVRALPVQGGGIVNREEDFEDFAERHHLRIKSHLHDFGVACGARADLTISRVRYTAAAIAGNDAVDAAQIFEDGFQTPEAAAGERGDFFAVLHIHSHPFNETCFAFVIPQRPSGCFPKAIRPAL